MSHGLARKQQIWILLAALAALGMLAAWSKPAPPCDGPCPITPGFQARYGSAFDPPGGAIVLDLPPDMREPNYAGGSCGHASMTTLMRSMGLTEFADWWRRTYSGAESLGGVIAKMEKAGLRYAYTSSGSMEFLQRCHDTGRGAVIFYKPRHIVNFVGLDAEYVYLLDNNATRYPERHGHYERIPRKTFEQNWKSNYGGRGWTLVYRPPIPRPTI